MPKIILTKDQPQGWRDAFSRNNLRRNILLGVLVLLVGTAPALSTALRKQFLYQNETRGPAQLDSATLTVITTSYEHHEIHAGSHFMVCDYDLGVANAATIDFVVVTPDTTEWPHMNFAFSSTEGATMQLYTGVTYTAGSGTTATPLNNDFNSDHASTLLVEKDPTIGGVGTRVTGWLAGGTREGGVAVREREIILKQNSTNLFRITSLGVGNDIGYCGEWYEHTNVE